MNNERANTGIKVCASLALERLRRIETLKTVPGFFRKSDRSRTVGPCSSRSNSYRPGLRNRPDGMNCLNSPLGPFRLVWTASQVRTILRSHGYGPSGTWRFKIYGTGLSQIYRPAQALALYGLIILISSPHLWFIKGANIQYLHSFCCKPTNYY